MKHFDLLSVLVLLLMASSSCGQSFRATYRQKLFMKVVTGEEVYKGRLYSVSDSGIRFISNPRQQTLPVMLAVRDIDELHFRRRGALINSMFRGIVAGAFCGGWLPSKLSWLGIHVSDNFFLYGYSIGAGLGLLIGILAAPIMKIDIPVNKCQRLFEAKKTKLQELSIY